MNRLYSRAGAFALSSALCLITVGRLSAQTTAAPAAVKPSEDETIVLSPFVVEAGEDTGYSAKYSLAGTRVRTELKDIGSAIQVVTQKFLQDTGSKNSQDLLVYTTNTEVGGQGGNFANLGNSAVLSPHSAATSPQSNTRVRGLDSADNTRDYFLSDIPWDGYIVGRVDIQRGANAVLFGIGSPAGIVNSSINGASFKDQNSVEFRLGSFGTSRESLDINKVLIKEELAVRFDLLNDETYYKQKPGFNHDNRYYGAIRYEPGFLNKGSAHTTLKANFEKGTVSANRPDPTPPIDAITPWFTQPINGVQQWTYDARSINTTDPVVIAASKTAGGINPANASYNRWINNGGAGGAIFDGLVAAFGNGAASSNSDYFMGSLRVVGAPTLDTGTGQNVHGWSVYRGIQPYNQYAVNASLPSQSLGVYKAKVINDPGVFDFYNNMIEGPNKHESQNFDAFNVALSQTFFNGKAGLEAVYDRQNYYQDQIGLFGDGTPWLTVDVISVLPDGRPNPNAGRAMIASRSNGNNSYETKRDSTRLTGFGEFDFREHMSKDSLLATVLGKHVITGLYSKAKTQTKKLSWDGQVVAPGFADDVDATEGARRMASVSYLGGSLIGKSLSSVNIPAPTAYQIMANGQAPYFNPTSRPGANNPPLTLDDTVGWQMKPVNILNGNDNLNDRKALYTFSDKLKEEISSKVFVWQAFLLNDTIVPMFSVRKDTDKSWDATRAPLFNYSGQPGWGTDDPNSPLWKYKDDPDATVEGTSKSYSLVLHTPKSVRSKMPWGTDISLFYNKSDNFRPSAGDVDILGHAIPSPSGKTKDYGITITTLNDKLTLKINRYKSSVTNARLTGDPGNGYAIGWGEGWAYMFARWAQLGIEGFSSNYALTNPTAPESAANPRIDPSIAVLRYQPKAGQSVADALSVQNAAIAAVISNEPPADFVNNWGIQRVSSKWDPTKGWGSAISPTYPNGLKLTGDTESKGTEVELVAQPTPQWSVSVNASKTDAERLNLAQSFAVWVEDRYKLYTTTPYGQVRFWNGANDQDSLVSFYQQFYGPYTLYRLQEGANVPELRPWHFTGVTNYSFKDGLLKNFNVGGSYRWANGIVTGYPIKNGTFDLANPYKGPTDTAVDLWVGYERKISHNIKWRIQLNVRNALAKKELIPISVQPDGSPGASRIADPRIWTLTNKFEF